MRSGIRRLTSILAPACIFAIHMFALAAGGAGAQEPLALSAGGLMFAPDPAIEFEEESVYLSARQVRASYRLRNTSDTDRSILVAMKLPDIPMADLAESSNVFGAREQVNFIGLEAFVDGEAQDMTFERRAMALGLDATIILEEESIPLGPDMRDMGTQISALDPATRGLMVERGILQIEDALFKPAWTLTTTYYWLQSLPAGKAVTIKINYKPVTGRRAYSPQRLARLKSDYCINGPTAVDIAERASRGGGSPYMSQVIYSITSSAHWHKLTGRFRLVIEKMDQSVVLATCLRGTRTLSATALEWTARDFAPGEDFMVLFVR